jgi:hypothetical protein
MSKVILFSFVIFVLVQSFLIARRSKSVSFYGGPFDDRFLAVFEKGEFYTLVDIKKIIEQELLGGTSVSQEDLATWLEMCVVEGKVTRWEGKMFLNDEESVIKYSLPFSLAD